MKRSNNFESSLQAFNRVITLSKSHSKFDVKILAVSADINSAVYILNAKERSVIIFLFPNLFVF